MCGIVGYIGEQQAVDVVLEGLRRLEYRGYDSAGISTLNNGQIDTQRAKGKLSNLEQQLKTSPLLGTLGIGHTRWATHGKPSKANAHPHRSGGFVVVHNGIIENYLQLKQQLVECGHHFNSETDSEIIAHLIDYHFKKSQDFEQAVRTAVQQLRGAFAIAVISDQHPDQLIAAKAGSPLVIGQGQSEYFVASDIPAMLSHTRDMVFLNDGEMALFNRTAMQITTLEGAAVETKIKTITWNPTMAEKGGYRHFMLKEIHEQPRAIADTIAGRITENKNAILLNELNLNADELNGFDRLYIVACGTSWHAALVGKFLIEKHARIPVEVDIASEFRYRQPLVSDKTLTLVISQSGETADTLAALREAHERGGKVVAICNVVESSIARESEGVIYTHAGPEIGVASTKAFTTQLVALFLFALHLGQTRQTLTTIKAQQLINELLTLPRKLEETLELDAIIEQAARKFIHVHDFLYLGRGNQYPIALEGALKLKEISYIHAEGYPAGEMKHGPIALIDEELPVVVIAPVNKTHEKVISNMEEVRARGGQIISISDSNCPSLLAASNVAFHIPTICDDLMPIITSIPLQLLSYHIAVFKGTDVDQPRNLAKSVTVE
ncbi:MAG: glutamine--fructose-6-phosphate transaminase (isomerizing) [Desulfobacteraceae bacterium 4572_35.2]|nr:MAG: glutamine--fructose-6-phosphate transaminase (isomerizing) [Desulfobacteraceae bacterium 4572_35.2]